MCAQLALFLFMLASALPASLAFNIDTTNPDVYNGEQSDFFGYKVLQFVSGSEKGILVTAPLQNNGSGGVCKPDTSNRTTKCFHPKELSLKDQSVQVKHFGLSIAEDATQSQFTVCSPYIAHECYDNSYLNGVCYKVTQDLQEVSYIKPIFQECRKKTVELVFLFDGSGSMTEDEFTKNKDFIKDIMDNLKNTSIKFAAVQFATSYRTVFDFMDYNKGSARQKLEEERHMESLTNTHQALEFVLKNLFENKHAGASSDASKVLVLITDGDPSDSDDKRIINTYNETGIIRFVIGVKNVALDKLKIIASDPKDKFAFKIEQYDGLTGLLENFQKHIFSMEGDTRVARAEDMTDEMSQSGFSAAFYKDTLILGSVGSNSWRGALYERHDLTETRITDSHMQMDSYMGYSVSVGQINNAPLYFTGAPRFQHTGQVLLFRRDGSSWNASQRINGDQIGSYFGAELCTIDVDSDGDSDFLLVGAPLFYHPQKRSEGQIYVYTLTDEVLLRREMNVTAAPSMGRFGTSIASLADLNGDGLRDVAVGAPLEDANAGAVYIFLGDRQRGIRSVFSQRLRGQKIKPGIRFFGQAINGNIDLGEDDLPDLVIGSYGAAIVLRSRPVMNVRARLSFQPKEISVDHIDCSVNTDVILPMVSLTVCFAMAETTTSKAEAMKFGLNISYTLNVDPMRQSYRGFFRDRKTRSLSFTYELINEETCFQYFINMTKCVKDTLSPISIKLNFSQVDSQSTGAVLNVDGKTQAVVEVPFEKHCRKNDTCIAEIEVDFKLLTPTLLVAEEKYFNMSVTISNHGDDSYNTSLTLYYPPGLSFSRMVPIITETTRQTRHNCDDLEGVTDKTICGVSLPVYRSRSAATFQTSFHISTEYAWNETIAIGVTGESDNNNNNTVAAVTKHLPVQFEIKMAITVKEETTMYLKFTEEDTTPKRMIIQYKVDNPGWKAFPVNVTLSFPTKLHYDFEIENYQVLVQQNQTRCKSIAGMISESCLPEQECKTVQCDSFLLNKESSTEFMLSADIQFRDLQQRAQNNAFLKRYTGENAEVRFKSAINVHFNEQRYVLDSHKQQNTGMTKEETPLWKDNNPTNKWVEVRVEFIISPDQYLIIFTGTGLGLLLLIIATIIMYKLGCFKRKTVQYYQEQEEVAALQQEGTPSQNNGFGSQTEDGPPAEIKTLLDGDQSADTQTEVD
ncbi:integrin alpha-D isoform X1 [Entelurus aequoreus]|uniref:integrin alpha-D isoform X1 n=2 Tax=Entelurus aequoreus TaxID=161455 RepID=UPI002B1D8164|nr:integrin alpha-D isoform X1 [Entelurus aequoreus]